MAETGVFKQNRILWAIFLVILQVCRRWVGSVALVWSLRGKSVDMLEIYFRKFFFQLHCNCFKNMHSHFLWIAVLKLFTISLNWNSVLIKKNIFNLAIIHLIKQDKALYICMLSIKLLQFKSEQQLYKNNYRKPNPASTTTVSGLWRTCSMWLW